MIAIQPRGKSLEWFHPDDVRHLRLEGETTLVTVMTRLQDGFPVTRTFHTERKAVAIAQDCAEFHSSKTVYLGDEPYVGDQA